jgi:hypothetical protein
MERGQTCRIRLAFPPLLSGIPEINIKYKFFVSVLFFFQQGNNSEKTKVIYTHGKQEQ